MKKILTLFAFLLVLSGCGSKDKVETIIEDHEDVVIFTVKSDGYMGPEITYEEFNKQLNIFFEDYDEEKDVIATMVEPTNNYTQHTITVYYFADSINDRLKTASEPVRFSDYKNSTAAYSEDNKYITNRSAAYDEKVSERYFNISLGEYIE